MSYEANITIFNILSIVNSQHREVVLISELNSFFNFDHNVFLLDSSAEINRFINTKGLKGKGVYSPNFIRFQ